MVNSLTTRQRVVLTFFVLLLGAVSAQEADAQGFIGSVVGFEAEFAYSPDFFGKASSQSSNVLVATGNFMLAPKFGPVQPFGLAGLGLMRTTVEGGGTSNDSNSFAWDVGGGLMIFFGEHFGIRGDIRYYHTFEALDLFNLPSVPNLPDLGISGKKLDFARTGVAVVFKF
jgi:opacity protein-like surface antigen